MTRVVERLPALPPTVRRARDLVRAQLGGSTQVDTVVLLTSEVVTNAVVHGMGPLVLVLDISPERTKVSVLDQSDAIPSVVRADLGDQGGRGLAIVDVLASRWGVDHDEDGRWIWFEVEEAGPGR